jgi:hypothetical protein
VGEAICTKAEKLSSPLSIFEKVCGAPEVQSGGGAMGTPSFAEAFELFGFGEFAFFVSDLESAADAEVVNGQNVGAAEVENQEHFGGPAPDAFDLGQDLKQLKIGSLVAFIECGDVSRFCPFGDLEDVTRFGPGQARTPKALDIGPQNLLRRGKSVLAEKRDKAAKDGAGRLAAQLLVSDCLDERLKGRQQARPKTQWADALNDFGHDRIGQGDVAHGFFVHKGNFARGAGEGKKT